MFKLIKLEDEVEEILRKIPITRNDDHILYVAYWEKKAPNSSFFDFFKRPKKYGCASFSAIERCRRKVQEKHPELKTREIAEYREELQDRYIEYAING